MGSQITWAATGELEYRFERMVQASKLRQTWRYEQPHQIGLAHDGSLWVLVDYNRLQHFRSDGSFIGQTSGFSDQISSLIASDGSLWRIADDYIQHINPDGTFISQFGGYGNSPGQLNQPKNLAIAYDGSVWVVDSGNRRIQHFSADGMLMTLFGNLGYDSNEFDGPAGIAASPDGSVWVTGSTYGSPIKHFNAEGTLIGQIPALRSSFYLSVAEDGSLWIIDNYYHSITHVNTDGTRINQFPTNSYILNLIAAGSSIWVLRNPDNKIQHLNVDGTLIAEFDNNTGDDFSYKGNGGLAVAEDNSVWAVDTYNARVFHLNADGSVRAVFGKEGRGPGQLSLPQGIALATDGSLWLADTFNNRIQHLNSDGTFISQFGSFGEGPGQLISPQDVALAPDGSLWVLGQNRLQHFHPDGTFIAQFGSEGSKIAVKADGSVVVLDTGNHRIQHFSADGMLMHIFGTEGSGTGQLSYPDSMAVAGDGSLWVSDSGNQRIQHFTANGLFISQLGMDGRQAGQFRTPKAIAFSKDENLWVAEQGNRRLQKFAPRPKGTTAHPYKAIIVAGSGEKLGSHANELWDGTWQVAQKANNTLYLQGFKPHDETLFLTAGNTEFDLDDNGQLDDLQAATKDSLRLAITDWAKDSTDVVLYLTGSANAGQFQLNATETLTAQELSAWLTELENKLPMIGKVTVVIEAPDAGSFVSALANSARPRYVIASTQAGQPALMADHGVNSFSYTFWSRVMDGAPLAEAFLAGQQAVGPFMVSGQAIQPAGDANGNGQADAQDAMAVGNYCLGMCNKTASQLPAINLPGQPSLAFKAASSLDFNVNVRPAANTHLLETWALVQRPAALGADPANALSLEKIPLNCDSSQHCTGRYGHFDTPGQYRVHFYALDSQYQLNAPAFLDIIIQPENTSALPAEYDSRQGLLTLRDVETSGQHYQAALQYQDGLYYLLTLGLTPNVLSPPAHFDAATNLLDVPLARINGQDYQGSFHLVDNYLFELLNATPK